MNREFLKQAGVPEDQIDKIMAEYGKDIQAEKDKAAKAASDIAERDKTIETYKTQVGPRTNAFGDGYLGTRELSPYRMHSRSSIPRIPFLTLHPGVPAPEKSLLPGANGTLDRSEPIFHRPVFCDLGTKLTG